MVAKSRLNCNSSLMSSINSITYKNICKTKYMPNWAHIPFLLWSDSGSDNMGLTFRVLHWDWDHGPWVLPLVKRVSLGGLPLHCMAPIWLKHTIHWRKKQTICQVSTKLPLYNLTRRPNPDNYRDFDGLNVFDYYSKGKAHIKKSST